MRMKKLVTGLIMTAMLFATGVCVNTASAELLRHVSGIGPSLAANIVSHRNANGAFKSRAELKRVKGLGANTL